MICKLCGRNFTQVHQNTKFCCDDHRDEFRRMRKRATAAKARAKRGPQCSPSMMPRPCILCGEVFKPRAPNQVVCTEVECRRSVNGKVTEDTESTCSICGAAFTLKAGSVRATCSPECQADASSRAQIGRSQKGRDEDRPKPESFDCPFQSMATGIMGFSTWDCPEIDPFGAGHYQARLDMGEAQIERRAA